MPRAALKSDLIIIFFSEKAALHIAGFKVEKVFDSKVKVAGKLRNVAINAWEKYESNNIGHDLWDLRPADHKTISYIIHLLKSNKGAGLDKIPTTLIRDAELELTPSIT